MMNRKFVVLLLLFAVLTSGCYINADVHTNQVGARLNRNEILGCVGPGVWSDGGFFADLRTISTDTVTFEVADPEVATADNQLVGVSITIQARRQSDCESVHNILTNWSTIVEDANLISVVDATAREGIKVGTRSFTLQQLLDDRNSLAGGIAGQLELDASRYSVDIVNVTVENIAIAEEYGRLLQERALLTAEIEREQRRQDLIRQRADNDRFDQEQRQIVLAEQLSAEEAQTAVEVEIAQREGRKTEAAQRVYQINEQAYELARLDRMGNILGEQAVIYFLPEGTDLTLLFNEGAANVVPVDVSP